MSWMEGRKLGWKGAEDGSRFSAKPMVPSVLARFRRWGMEGEEAPATLYDMTGCLAAAAWATMSRARSDMACSTCTLLEGSLACTSQTSILLKLRAMSFVALVFERNAREDCTIS